MKIFKKGIGFCFTIVFVIVFSLLLYNFYQDVFMNKNLAFFSYIATIAFAKSFIQTFPDLFSL